MDTISQGELDEVCRAVPLFPLPGVVFLPSSLLPLHVFEPRYRALVDDVLAGPKVVAVPQLAPGWEGRYEERPAVLPICGVGRIVRHQRLPDGRHNIILLGLGRVRIEAELPGARPYRVAQARLLHPPSDRGRVGADERAVGGLRALVGQAAATGLEAGAELVRLLEQRSSPESFVDKVAHLVLRDAGARQEYLETEQLAGRADHVAAHLAAQLAPAASIDA
jgi:uncharacterized protein